MVEVFYSNLKVLNRVIHSRVKGVNITIDDNVWSYVAGLKAQGLDSHIRDFDSNRWLTKKKSERDEIVEDTLFKLEKKGNKNDIDFETEDSNDESTDED
ncbi:hypothetical protein LR48_Vigan08g065600 [Vigna angularis]|uniref:Uncharacterized protein n=1 Tax=Phaseolus angularis TaxID=3914 RepID=A0A0L9V544_PHAAN|nr:hypothetical protein LR48_Vigan08g065600 [Vigna angularis]